MTATTSPPPVPASAEPRPLPQPSYRVDIPGVDHLDLRPVKWQLYLSLVGLGLGLLMGLLQALERLDTNLYDQVPVIETYYQGLTLHGVALALVFTFTFANALMSLTTMRGLRRPMASRQIAEASLWLAWIGVTLAAYAILANKATVLFTFYSPLEATPAFYIGAVFLVVSTWLTLLNQVLTLRAWRREHPGERIPLLAFVSIVTMLMWFIASMGIAIEVLVFILPWSLGWRDTVDPQFNRILFWFTGHPIVYFWLLPVYVSWYLMLPKMVGGKLYSDGITRLVFLSFLVLLPVGVHHQFTDPGIPISSKSIQWVLTFAIFYPSMVTAFSVFSALEGGARRRGGTGRLRWVTALPWGDPAVSAQLLAGLGFMLGGASGIVNASYTLNLAVHNSSFVVGHFHLTVGTAVALTIMGICYWLVPYLTGRQLALRGLAVVQTWTWFIGVTIFARGQMQGGIEGMPRRTQISDAVYLADHKSWDLANLFTGVGGILMFIGGCMFFVVILRTLFNKQKVTGVQTIPVSEVIHGPRETWLILDRLGLWAIVGAAFAALVYGEVILHYLPLNSVAKGIRVW